jgi:hypothetical protein
MIAEVEVRRCNEVLALHVPRLEASGSEIELEALNWARVTSIEKGIRLEGALAIASPRMTG